MKKTIRTKLRHNGFSLIELCVAIAVSIPVMSIAATFIAEGNKVSLKAIHDSNTKAAARKIGEILFDGSANCKDFLGDNVIVGFAAAATPPNQKIKINNLESSGFPNAMFENEKLPNYGNIELKNMTLNEFQDIGIDPEGNHLFNAKLEMHFANFNSDQGEKVELVAKPNIAIDNSGKVIACKASKKIAANGVCDTNLAGTTCVTVYDATLAGANPNCVVHDNIVTGLALNAAGDAALNCNFDFKVAPCAAGEIMADGKDFIAAPNCVTPAFAQVVN